jgi:hypothetical protein
VFESFSLPDLARVSRRTVLGAIVVGVVGLGVCVVVNQLLAGLGLALGLALGLGNFRMIQRSVVKVGARADEAKRRPLAVNTLGRLGIITAVALGFLFLSLPLGFGIMAGLAAFQVLLLLNVTRSMVAMGRAPGGAVIDVNGVAANGTPAGDIGARDFGAGDIGGGDMGAGDIGAGGTPAGGHDAGPALGTDQSRGIR